MYMYVGIQGNWFRNVWLLPTKMPKRWRGFGCDNIKEGSQSSDVGGFIARASSIADAQKSRFQFPTLRHICASDTLHHRRLWNWHNQASLRYDFESGVAGGLKSTKCKNCGGRVRGIVAFDSGLPPHPLDLLKYADADARQSTRVTTPRHQRECRYGWRLMPAS